MPPPTEVFIAIRLASKSPKKPTYNISSVAHAYVTTTRRGCRSIVTQPNTFRIRGKGMNRNHLLDIVIEPSFTYNGEDIILGWGESEVDVKALYYTWVHKQSEENGRTMQKIGEMEWRFTKQGRSYPDQYVWWEFPRVTVADRVSEGEGGEGGETGDTEEEDGEGGDEKSKEEHAVEGDTGGRNYSEAAKKTRKMWSGFWPGTGNRD